MSLIMTTLMKHGVWNGQSQEKMTHSKLLMIMIKVEGKGFCVRTQDLTQNYHFRSKMK